RGQVSVRPPSSPDDRKTTSSDRKTTSRFIRWPPTVKRSNGGAELSLHPIGRRHATGGMCESDPDQVPQHRKDDLHGLLDGSTDLRGCADRGDGPHPVPRLSSGALVVEAGRPVRKGPQRVSGVDQAEGDKCPSPNSTWRD